ncbi:MAG: Pathogenicity locus [Clostridiales bacterium]|nr:helix-hairpin-helix domain-containing protein [Bacillota bacterium]NLK89975.1 Pathogenicity locus [Clostridiales bacterium]
MSKIDKPELMKIPGVGSNMAKHLIKAGFPTIESLKGQNPDDIYAADCIAQGTTVDKCALYCYRLAVYYADHDGQLPENKLHWWNWKD